MSTNITVKKSKTSIIISIILLIAGATFLFLQFKTAQFIGGFFLFFGIISLIFTKKEKIYIPSGSKITSEMLYFNPLEKGKLNEILSNKNFPLLKNITPTEHGIQMEVTRSKDKEYAAVQLYDYVPHHYVESSPLYEYIGNDAKSFSEILNETLL